MRHLALILRRVCNRVNVEGRQRQTDLLRIKLLLVLIQQVGLLVGPPAIKGLSVLWRNLAFCCYTRSRLCTQLLSIAFVFAFSVSASYAQNNEASGDSSNAEPVANNSDNPQNLCDSNPVDDCPFSSPSPDASNGSFTPNTTVGNPISLVTRNKYQLERDYRVAGTVLEFSRHYNSRSALTNVGVGQGWSSTYGTRLVKHGDDSYVIYESTGNSIYFDSVYEDKYNHRRYRSASNSNGTLRKIDEHKTEWELPDGRVITFKGSYLAHIDFPGHRELTLKYHYGSRNIQLSDQVRTAIRKHIDDNNGVLNPDDGLPGFHAEVVAVNDIYNQANAVGKAVGHLDIATVRPRTGDDFPACANCGSILQSLNELKTVLKGVIEP